MNLSTRLEKIDKKFDKKFGFSEEYGYYVDGREPDDTVYPDEMKDFIHSVIQQEIKEAFKAVMPEKTIIELEEPRLYQYDSTPNEFGGYSSVPFACSLCQMDEMKIQDNKMQDGNYHCHCSVWDNPCGGKWLKWFDKDKALESAKELLSEDNLKNSFIDQIKSNQKEYLK